MKAPKEVVEYLDKNAPGGILSRMICVLFSEGGLLDVDDIELSNPVNKWVYSVGLDQYLARSREQAVIDHVFGTGTLEAEE